MKLFEPDSPDYPALLSWSGRREEIFPLQMDAGKLAYLALGLVDYLGDEHPIWVKVSDRHVWGPAEHKNFAYDALLRGFGIEKFIWSDCLRFEPSEMMERYAVIASAMFNIWDIEIMREDESRLTFFISHDEDVTAMAEDPAIRADAIEMLRSWLVP